MSTPKLSDIFRHAADNLDTTNESPDRWSTYSCDRIVASSAELTGFPRLYSNASTALNYYPLADVPQFGGFNEFSPGLERQSARFLWLCMLAEIAESEGL